MSKNKKIKSIGFNITNEKDKKRLDFIGRKSFSKLVKRLIDEAIERQSKTEEVEEPAIEEKPIKKEMPPQSGADRLERLKQKQKRGNNVTPPFINQQKN